MFDGVPFGSTGREVTNGDRKAESIGHLDLKLMFPGSGLIAIAAASVAQDEQFQCVGIKVRTGALPPVADGVNGESWCIGRLTDVDIAQIALDVVDAIGHGDPAGILTEVMSIDIHGLRAPNSSWVVEKADQFLAFGVYADDRPAHRLKEATLVLQVTKLPAPVRVLSGL